MCEACLTAATEHGEVVPGWTLIRATVDGHEMKAGQWGLVYSNGPSFIWTPDPIPDPDFGKPDDELNAQTDEESARGQAWGDLADAFMAEVQCMKCGFGAVCRLTMACREAGWNEDYGYVEFWLFHRMGVLLRDGKVEADEEAPAEGKPRAYTVDEVRSLLLEHFWGLIRYWRDLPGKTVQERMEGLAFSICSALDGAPVGLPAFQIVPSPHPTDKAYHREQGENWFPEGDVDIGPLHEFFHQARPANADTGPGATPGVMVRINHWVPLQDAVPALADGVIREITMSDLVDWLACLYDVMLVRCGSTAEGKPDMRLVLDAKGRRFRQR